MTDEASAGIGTARKYHLEELAGAATCETRLPSVVPRRLHVFPIPTIFRYFHLQQLSFPTFPTSSSHSFITMADETPQRQSEDQRPPSPPLNSAYANRHGDRAYMAIYPGTRLSLIPSASESSDREQEHTPSPLDRLHVPDTQPLVRPPDSRTAASARPSRSESESSRSATSAQDTLDTPIRSNRSSRPTDAWWTEQRRGLHSQNSFNGTDVLNYGQYLNDPLVNDPSPEASSSALPTASVTDADSRPTRELPDTHLGSIAQLPTFSTPSSSSVSDRARSDAFSTPNTSPLPARAHNAALSMPNTAPPSSHRHKSSSAAPDTNANLRPARYRHTPSSSSVSPVSAHYPNTSLSTPNVSPLSGHRPEPVSSPAAVYTPPSGHRLSVTAPRNGNSSSTLFFNRDQQAPLTEQQPEAQLERAESQMELIPEQSEQPTGDGVPASSTENAAQTDPAQQGMYSSWYGKSVIKQITNI